MTCLRPLALAALLLPCLTPAAEVVALLPVTGANVDAGTLEAARDVLRGHLERTGREVRFAAGDPVHEPTPGEAASAAQEVGARRVAVLRMSRLGAVLRARLAVYDVPSARTVHTDDLPAATENDLDPVLQRLAEAYAQSDRATRVAQIDTVTDKEARPLNRIPAHSGFGVRLGGITPFNPGGSESGTGGGFFWQYDARSFLMDIGFDAFWGRRYNDFSLGFGAYVPLTAGNLSPYVGGGLHYGWARFERSWGAGLQPQVAAGLLLGRLTTVQIRAEVAWFYATFKTNELNANGLLWTVAAVF